MPTAARMPEYLRDHMYQHPNSNQETAFAHVFGQDFWAHLNADPAGLTNFNTYMETRRHNQPAWFEAYPVKDNLLSGFNGSQNGILLIQVGGGLGHDLVNLKSRLPKSSGRILLQEQEDVISNLSAPLKGIECMVHDIFKPQPIKGKFNPDKSC